MDPDVALAIQDLQGQIDELTQTTQAEALQQLTPNVPQQLDSPILARLAAWTTIPPAGQVIGPLDVSGFGFLAGYIGLQPTGATGHVAGVVFRWWSDANMSMLVGVQSWSLSDLIVSNALLSIPNQGPFVTIEIDPIAGTGTGPCTAAMAIFATNRAYQLPFLPADPLLIDEFNTPIATSTSTTYYPDDYFAGPIQVYFYSTEGALNWNIYMYDNLGQIWPVAGDYADPVDLVKEVLAPPGAWFLVISNTSTAFPASYNVTVTASFTGGV